MPQSANAPAPRREVTPVASDNGLRQQVLVLYLASSALDSNVIGWALHDGAADGDAGPGATDDPPYRSGVHALRDGWRLIQASPLLAAPRGQEFVRQERGWVVGPERLVERAQAG